MSNAKRKPNADSPGNDDKPNAPSASPEHTEPPYPSPGYSWYVVGVLILIYIFSFADRQLLNYLVDNIKTGLNLTEDRHVAILMGPAFAIFYAIFGFPLGRLADSKSRRTLIAAGLTVWSLMAAGCGAAKNFVSFMGFRIGVGIGEASLSPSAYSIITDIFPRHKLGTAISAYGTGIYIGSGLAALMGAAAIAMLKEGDPWQQVFVIVGGIGLIGVPLMYTIKEPIRRGMLGPASAKRSSIPMREVISYMKQNWQTIGCHNFGFALLAFSSYGTGAWIPSYFIRNHGWEREQVAVWYGTIIMIFGTLGIIAGGWLADRLARQGYRDSKMRMGLIGALIWAPTGMIYPWISDPYVAMAVIAPTVFTASMPFGVAPAAIQEIMPNQMRGQASAMYLFIVNIIGLAVGPYVLAFFSDKVFGQDHINHSLFWVASVAHFISALLLWRGLKHFLRSRERLEEYTKNHA